MADMVAGPQKLQSSWSYEEEGTAQVHTERNSSADGPSPPSHPAWPPVTPIPVVEDGQYVESTSYVSGLYDTYQSKPKVKNGDREWKPKNDRIENVCHAVHVVE